MTRRRVVVTGLGVICPVGNNVQAAWEKLHRARELLEAEQNHLRDERTVLFDQQHDLKRRADAVATREAR